MKAYLVPGVSGRSSWLQGKGMTSSRACVLLASLFIACSSSPTESTEDDEKSPDGSGGSDGGDGDEVRPAVLCDGSEGVNFSVRYGGGEVDDYEYFLSTRGTKYLYVSGGCDFIVNVDPLNTPRAGTLTEELRAELEADVEYSHLFTTYAESYSSCDDHPGTSLSNAETSAFCSCGRGDDKLDGITEKARKWIDRLWDEGAEATSQPIEILVWPRTDVSAIEPFAWPIDDDVATFAAEKQNPNPDSAALSGADAQALRSLRDEYYLAHPELTLFDPGIPIISNDPEVDHFEVWVREAPDVEFQR